MAAELERAVISGLQTLRIVAIAAGGAFFLLVLPSAFVAPSSYFRLHFQVPAIALMLLGAAAAALAIRYLQLRPTHSPRSTEDIALAFRTRFLLQVTAAQIPGAIAFGASVFSRRYPGVAILLGVVATALLVWSVAPTSRNLDRLQDEAREHGIHGDVRAVLDQLYSWRP